MLLSGFRNCRGIFSVKDHLDRAVHTRIVAQDSQLERSLLAGVECIGCIVLHDCVKQDLAGLGNTAAHYDDVGIHNRCNGGDCLTQSTSEEINNGKGGLVAGLGQPL